MSFLNQRCNNYIYIVKVTLTSARCDTIVTYADGDDDLQTGAENGWVRFLCFNVGAIDVDGLT